MLDKYDVHRPPDPEPWLNDVYERAVSTPIQMDTDTLNRMLARAPVWRMRRRGAGG